MKQVLLVFFVLMFGLQVVSAQEADCDPVAVREWMVQRQMGRNQIEPLLAEGSTMGVMDGLLLIQSVRRTLEDLPRPACADELYQLTIFFYDTMGDAYTFALANNPDSASRMADRLARYGANVDPLYEELQTIAGVDVLEETARRGSVVPTAMPTQVVEPMIWTGSDATVLGPVTIPPGLYRTTATTDQFITAVITPSQGECGVGTGNVLAGGLFNLSVGQAVAGAEVLLTSRGCTALIQVSNVQSSWTLALEKVG